MCIVNNNWSYDVTNEPNAKSISTFDKCMKVFNQNSPVYCKQKLIFEELLNKRVPFLIAGHI